MNEEEQKEPTWWDVISAFWGLLLLVLAVIALIAAGDAYFVKDDRDVANVAFYLALSVWLEVCAERHSP